METLLGEIARSEGHPERVVVLVLAVPVVALLIHLTLKWVAATLQLVLVVTSASLVACLVFIGPDATLGVVRLVIAGARTALDSVQQRIFVVRQ
jgi:uncharacterized protein (DUF983 family)